MKLWTMIRFIKPPRQRNTQLHQWRFSTLRKCGVFPGARLGAFAGDSAPVGVQAGAMNKTNKKRILSSAQNFSWTSALALCEFSPRIVVSDPITTHWLCGNRRASSYLTITCCDVFVIFYHKCLANLHRTKRNFWSKCARMCCVWELKAGHSDRLGHRCGCGIRRCQYSMLQQWSANKGLRFCACPTHQHGDWVLF